MIKLIISQIVLTKYGSSYYIFLLNSESIFGLTHCFMYMNNSLKFGIHIMANLLKQFLLLPTMLDGRI